MIDLWPVHFFYSDGIKLFSDGIDHPTESAKTVFFFPIGLKKIRRIVCIPMESFCKPFVFAQKNPSRNGQIPTESCFRSRPKERQLRIFVTTVCSLQ